jgi:hypothetical protein
MSDHTQYKLRRREAPQFADCFNFHKVLNLVQLCSSIQQHILIKHVHDSEAAIWMHQFLYSAAVGNTTVRRPIGQVCVGF